MSAQWSISREEPEETEDGMGLDRALALLEAGAVYDAMDVLVETLRGERDRLTPSEWRRYVGEHVVSHPINALALEDPFTSHSRRRPRGRQGDAVLVDHAL